MTKTLFSLALAGAVAVGASPVLSSLSPQTHTASTARLSGSSIVGTALSYVGYRYAYVGDTPYTGFSCTGFVHWVFSQYGYNTPEDVGTLYYSYPHVYTSNLEPGDVLIFANTFHAGLSHAAIYIGNGQMVGADNFTVGVHVDYLFDSYWGPRFVGGIRIAPTYYAPAVQAPAPTSTPAPAPTSTPVPPAPVERRPVVGVRPHVVTTTSAALVAQQQQVHIATRAQTQRQILASRLMRVNAWTRSARQEALADIHQAAAANVMARQRFLAAARTKTATTARGVHLAAAWPSPRFSSMV